MSWNMRLLEPFMHHVDFTIRLTDICARYRYFCETSVLAGMMERHKPRGSICEIRQSVTLLQATAVKLGLRQISRAEIKAILYLEAAGDLICFVLQLYTALLNAAHHLSKSWIKSLLGMCTVAVHPQALSRKVMQGRLARMILLQHRDSWLSKRCLSKFEERQTCNV